MGQRPRETYAAFQPLLRSLTFTAGKISVSLEAVRHAAYQKDWRCLSLLIHLTDQQFMMNYSCWCLSGVQDSITPFNYSFLWQQKKRKGLTSREAPGEFEVVGLLPLFLVT